MSSLIILRASLLLKHSCKVWVEKCSNVLLMMESNTVVSIRGLELAVMNRGDFLQSLSGGLLTGVMYNW